MQPVATGECSSPSAGTSWLMEPAHSLSHSAAAKRVATAAQCCTMEQARPGPSAVLTAGQGRSRGARTGREPRGPAWSRGSPGAGMAAEEQPPSPLRLQLCSLPQPAPAAQEAPTPPQAQLPLSRHCRCRVQGPTVAPRQAPPPRARLPLQPWLRRMRTQQPAAGRGCGGALGPSPKERRELGWRWCWDCQKESQTPACFPASRAFSTAQGRSSHAKIHCRQQKQPLAG